MCCGISPEAFAEQTSLQLPARLCQVCGTASLVAILVVASRTTTPPPFMSALENGVFTSAVKKCTQLLNCSCEGGSSEDASLLHDFFQSTQHVTSPKLGAHVPLIWLCWTSSFFVRHDEPGSKGCPYSARKKNRKTKKNSHRGRRQTPKLTASGPCGT